MELYGRYVRRFVDAPLEGARGPGRGGGDADQLRDPPGPVHLNLPFDEPPVPERHGKGLPTRGRGRGARLARVEQAGPTSAGCGGEPPDVLDLLRTDRLLDADRVPVAGAMPAPPIEVLELAERLGWPAAELISGLRHPAGALAAGQHLLDPSPGLRWRRPLRGGAGNIEPHPRRA
ncbi:MAG: hypothetical protein U0V56_04020 [Actinomycetota bacterium]